MRQQIAGELLDRELVERQIAVEGADHPVAPRPHAAIAVDVVAVRVGVAGGVEPRHGHPLAVVRRLQERVDALLVGVGRTVGEKGVELGRRRRQARQVEVTRRRSVALSASGDGLRPSASSRARMKRSIGFLTHSSFLSVGRRLRAHRRRIGPVRVPFGAFVNPAPQQLDLFGGQRVPGIGRRHPLLRIGVGDPLDQHAPRGAARHDDAVLRKRAFLRVEVNSVSRCFASGPWQAKQLLERIGRMSRLKLSGCEPAWPVRAAGLAALPEPGQVNTPPRRTRGSRETACGVSLPHLTPEVSPSAFPSRPRPPTPGNYRDGLASTGLLSSSSIALNIVHRDCSSAIRFVSCACCD